MGVSSSGQHLSFIDGQIATLNDYGDAVVAAYETTVALMAAIESFAAATADRITYDRNAAYDSCARAAFLAAQLITDRHDQLGKTSKLAKNLLGTTKPVDLPEPFNRPRHIQSGSACEGAARIIASIKHDLSPIGSPPPDCPKPVDEIDHIAQTLFYRWHREHLPVSSACELACSENTLHGLNELLITARGEIQAAVENLKAGIPIPPEKRSIVLNNAFAAEQLGITIGQLRRWKKLGTLRYLDLGRESLIIHLDEFPPHNVANVTPKPGSEFLR